MRGLPTGLAVALLVAACAGGTAGDSVVTTTSLDSSPTTAADSEPWGQEAVDWWQGFIEASREGPWHMVSFLAPDLVWDERVGEDHIVGEEAWVEHQAGLAPDALPWPGVAVMAGLDRPVLLSADEMLVQYAFHAGSWPTIDYLDRMVLGPEGVSHWVTAASLASGRHYVPWRLDFDQVDALVDDYVALWNGSSGMVVTDVYRPEAEISDTLLGIMLNGVEEIEEAASSAASVASPRLAILSMPDGEHRAVFSCRCEDGQGLFEVRFLLEVEDGSGCPGTVGVVLAQDGSRVLWERRYHDVESVRRCFESDELETGWWAGMSAPETRVIEQTGTVTLDGLTVDVFNGTRAAERFLEWGFERYAQAGLPLPRVESVTFLQSVTRCRGVGGRAVRTAEGTRITLCTSMAELCLDEECTEWERAARTVWLHELAHAWIDDYVNDATRSSFLDLVGMERWADHDDPWTQRGVELAANAIAYSLMDEPVTLGFDFQGTCDQRDEGFRLLTGADPLVPCNSPSDEKHG